VHEFKTLLSSFLLDDARFTAWLKDERDHWYILLQELWAGKVVSKGNKDIMAANRAANNVQLIDAVLKRYKKCHSPALVFYPITANQVNSLC